VMVAAMTQRHKHCDVTKASPDSTARSWEIQDKILPKVSRSALSSSMCNFSWQLEKPAGVYVCVIDSRPNDQDLMHLKVTLQISNNSEEMVSNRGSADRMLSLQTSSLCSKLLNIYTYFASVVSHLL